MGDAINAQMSHPPDDKQTDRHLPYAIDNSTNTPTMDDDGHVVRSLSIQGPFARSVTSYGTGRHGRHVSSCTASDIRRRKTESSSKAQMRRLEGGMQEQRHMSEFCRRWDECSASADAIMRRIDISVPSHIREAT